MPEFRSVTSVIASVHQSNLRTDIHILLSFVILQFILNTCCLTSSCQATVASSGCSLCQFCLLPCCYQYQSDVTTVSLTGLCFHCGVQKSSNRNLNMLFTSTLFRFPHCCFTLPVTSLGAGTIRPKVLENVFKACLPHLSFFIKFSFIKCKSWLTVLTFE